MHRRSQTGWRHDGAAPSEHSESKMKDDRSRRRTESRAALVDVAGRFRDACGLPNRRGCELFARAYNAGEIVVVDWIREGARMCHAAAFTGGAKRHTPEQIIGKLREAGPPKPGFPS